MHIAYSHIYMFRRCQTPSQFYHGNAVYLKIKYLSRPACYLLLYQRNKRQFFKFQGAGHAL